MIQIQLYITQTTIKKRWSSKQNDRSQSQSGSESEEESLCARQEYNSGHRTRKQSIYTKSYGHIQGFEIRSLATVQKEHT
jgi:hypothetical protein